uniref:Mucin-5AC-like n=1 Tax=Syphacia muris TaxID=451379 RepID=A0A0N5AT33_9BILA
MGVVNTEEPEISIEMTSKPKERQFQVVPVPGVFTRGRWKCWDYRDEPVMDDKILNYADKADKLTPTNKETNEPVIQVNKLYILLFEPGTANLITAVPIANEGNLNNVNTVLDVPTVVEPLSKTASEPQLPFESSGILPSNPNPSQGVLPSVASEGSTLMPKESSTIVVTSIAPATATPSNISSLPVTAATSPEPTFESTNQIPVVSSTLTILSEGEASNPSVSLSPPVAHCSTTATISLGGSASPQPGTSSTTFVGSTNMTANVPNPSVISCTGPGGIGQTSRQILNRETAGAQFKNTSSPVLSRQTSLASFSEGAVASIPMLSPIESVLEDA